MLTDKSSGKNLRKLCTSTRVPTWISLDPNRFLFSNGDTTTLGTFFKTVSCFRARISLSTDFHSVIGPAPPASHQPAPTRARAFFSLACARARALVRIEWWSVNAARKAAQGEIGRKKICKSCLKVTPSRNWCVTECRGGSRNRLNSLPWPQQRKYIKNDILKSGLTQLRRLVWEFKRTNHPCAIVVRKNNSSVTLFVGFSLYLGETVNE